MSTATLERRHSTVIDWMSSAKNRASVQTQLVPSEHAEKSMHHVGLIGLVATLAWCAALISGVFAPKMLQFLIGHISTAALFLLPFSLMLIGVTLLVVIKVSLSLARVVTPLVCCVFWPICISLTALPHPFIASLAFGFLSGTASLILAPRWEKLRVSKQQRRALWEKLFAFLIPAAIFLFYAKLTMPETPQIGSIILALCASLISWRAYRSFADMCRSLTALREPGDEQGVRSALIVMSCFWLWPVWFADGWGWFITGVRFSK